MKKFFGWTILLLFFAGLLSIDAIKYGWLVAICTFIVTAVLAGVLTLATFWVSR